MKGISAIVFLSLFSLFHCKEDPTYNYIEKGVASYYHSSLDGRLTASGLPYNESDLSAAHLWLPFGTEVKVVDVETKNEVLVTINDRGPFVKGRIIDLSRMAADSLGILNRGIAEVIIKAYLPSYDPKE